MAQAVLIPDGEDRGPGLDNVGASGLDIFNEVLEGNASKKAGTDTVEGSSVENETKNNEVLEGNASSTAAGTDTKKQRRLRFSHPAAMTDDLEERLDERKDEDDGKFLEKTKAVTMPDSSKSPGSSPANSPVERRKKVDTDMLAYLENKDRLEEEARSSIAYRNHVYWSAKSTAIEEILRKCVNPQPTNAPPVRKKPGSRAGNGIAEEGEEDGDLNCNFNVLPESDKLWGMSLMSVTGEGGGIGVSVPLVDTILGHTTEAVNVRPDEIGLSGGRAVDLALLPFNTEQRDEQKSKEEKEGGESNNDSELEYNYMHQVRCVWSYDKRCFSVTRLRLSGRADIDFVCKTFDENISNDLNNHHNNSMASDALKGSTNDIHSTRAYPGGPRLLGWLRARTHSSAQYPHGLAHIRPLCTPGDLSLALRELGDPTIFADGSIQMPNAHQGAPSFVPKGLLHGNTSTSTKGAGKDKKDKKEEVERVSGYVRKSGVYYRYYYKMNHPSDGVWVMMTTGPRPPSTLHEALDLPSFGREKADKDTASLPEGASNNTNAEKNKKNKGPGTMSTGSAAVSKGEGKDTSSSSRTAIGTDTGTNTDGSDKPKIDPKYSTSTFEGRKASTIHKRDKAILQKKWDAVRDYLCPYYCSHLFDKKVLYPVHGGTGKGGDTGSNSSVRPERVSQDLWAAARMAVEALQQLHDKQEKQRRQKEEERAAGIGSAGVVTNNSGLGGTDEGGHPKYDPSYKRKLLLTSAVLDFEEIFEPFALKSNAKPSDLQTQGREKRTFRLVSCVRTTYTPLAPPRRLRVEQLSTEKAVFLRYFSERFQAEFLEQYRSQTDRLLGKGGGKPIPQLAVAAVAVGTKLGKETKDEGKEVKEKEGKKRLVLPFHSTYAQGAAAATGNIQASITPAEQTENRMTATLADAGEIAVQREEQVVYFSLTEAGAELCASATRSAVRAASDLWEELEDAQFPLDERKERKRNTKNNKNSRKEVNGNRAIAQNAQSPSKISSPSSNGSPINGMRLVQFGGDKPPPPISERGNKGEREGGEGGGDDEKEEEEEDVQPDEFSSDEEKELLPFMQDEVWGEHSDDYNFNSDDSDSSMYDDSSDEGGDSENEEGNTTRKKSTASAGAREMKFFNEELMERFKRATKVGELEAAAKKMQDKKLLKERLKERWATQMEEQEENNKLSVKLSENYQQRQRKAQEVVSVKRAADLTRSKASRQGLTYLAQYMKSAIENQYLLNKQGQGEEGDMSLRVDEFLDEAHARLAEECGCEREPAFLKPAGYKYFMHRDIVAQGKLDRGRESQWAQPKYIQKHDQKDKGDTTTTEAGAEANAAAATEEKDDSFANTETKMSKAIKAPVRGLTEREQEEQYRLQALEISKAYPPSAFGQAVPYVSLTAPVGEPNLPQRTPRAVTGWEEMYEEALARVAKREQKWVLGDIDAPIGASAAHYQTVLEKAMKIPSTDITSTAGRGENRATRKKRLAAGRRAIPQYMVFLRLWERISKTGLSKAIVKGNKNLGPAPPKKKKKGPKHTTLASKREEEAKIAVKASKKEQKYPKFDSAKNVKSTLYRNPWTQETSPRAVLEQASSAKAVATNMEGHVAVLTDDTLQTGNEAFKALEQSYTSSLEQGLNSDESDKDVSMSRMQLRNKYMKEQSALALAGKIEHRGPAAPSTISTGMGFVKNDPQNKENKSALAGAGAGAAVMAQLAMSSILPPSKTSKPPKSAETDGDKDKNKGKEPPLTKTALRLQEARERQYTSEERSYDEATERVAKGLSVLDILAGSVAVNNAHNPKSKSAPNAAKPSKEHEQESTLQYPNQGPKEDSRLGILDVVRKELLSEKKMKADEVMRQKIEKEEEHRQWHEKFLAKQIKQTELQEKEQQEGVDRLPESPGLSKNRKKKNNNNNNNNNSSRLTVTGSGSGLSSPGKGKAGDAGGMGVLASPGKGLPKKGLGQKEDQNKDKDAVEEDVTKRKESDKDWPYLRDMLDEQNFPFKSYEDLEEEERESRTQLEMLLALMPREMANKVRAGIVRTAKRFRAKRRNILWGMRRPKPGEELDYHNRHLWESDDEEFDSEEEDPAPKVRKKYEAPAEPDGTFKAKEYQPPSDVSVDYGDFKRVLKQAVAFKLRNLLLDGELMNQQEILEERLRRMQAYAEMGRLEAAASLVKAENDHAQQQGIRNEKNERNDKEDSHHVNAEEAVDLVAGLFRPRRGAMLVQTQAVAKAAAKRAVQREEKERARVLWEEAHAPKPLPVRANSLWITKDKKDKDKDTPEMINTNTCISEGEEGGTSTGPATEELSAAALQQELGADEGDGGSEGKDKNNNGTSTAAATTGAGNSFCLDKFKHARPLHRGEDVLTRGSMGAGVERMTKEMKAQVRGSYNYQNQNHQNKNNKNQIKNIVGPVAEVGSVMSVSSGSPSLREKSLLKSMRAVTAGHHPNAKKPFKKTKSAPERNEKTEDKYAHTKNHGLVLIPGHGVNAKMQPPSHPITRSHPPRCPLVIVPQLLPPQTNPNPGAGTIGIGSVAIDTQRHIDASALPIDPARPDVEFDDESISSPNPNSPPCDLAHTQLSSLSPAGSRAPSRVGSRAGSPNVSRQGSDRLNFYPRHHSPGSSNINIVKGNASTNVNIGIIGILPNPDSGRALSEGQSNLMRERAGADGDQHIPTQARNGPDIGPEFDAYAAYAPIFAPLGLDSSNMVPAPVGSAPLFPYVGGEASGLDVENSSEITAEQILGVKSSFWANESNDSSGRDLRIGEKTTDGQSHSMLEGRSIAAELELSDSFDMGDRYQSRVDEFTGNRILHVSPRIMGMDNMNMDNKEESLWGLEGEGVWDWGEDEAALTATAFDFTATVAPSAELLALLGPELADGRRSESTVDVDISISISITSTPLSPANPNPNAAREVERESKSQTSEAESEQAHAQFAGATRAEVGGIIRDMLSAVVRRNRDQVVDGMGNLQVPSPSGIGNLKFTPGQRPLSPGKRNVKGKKVKIPPFGFSGPRFAPTVRSAADEAEKWTEDPNSDPTPAPAPVGQGGLFSRPAVTDKLKHPPVRHVSPRLYNQQEVVRMQQARKEELERRARGVYTYGNHNNFDNYDNYESYESYEGRDNVNEYDFNDLPQHDMVNVGDGEMAEPSLDDSLGEGGEQEEGVDGEGDTDTAVPMKSLPLSAEAVRLPQALVDESDEEDSHTIDGTQSVRYATESFELDLARSVYYQSDPLQEQEQRSVIEDLRSPSQKGFKHEDVIDKEKEKLEEKGTNKEASDLSKAQFARSKRFKGSNKYVRSDMESRYVLSTSTLGPLDHVSGTDPSANLNNNTLVVVSQRIKVPPVYPSVGAERRVGESEPPHVLSFQASASKAISAAAHANNFDADSMDSTDLLSINHINTKNTKNINMNIENTLSPLRQVQEEEEDAGELLLSMSYDIHASWAPHVDPLQPPPQLIGISSLGRAKGGYLNHQAQHQVPQGGGSTGTEQVAPASVTVSEVQQKVTQDQTEAATQEEKEEEKGAKKEKKEKKKMKETLKSIRTLFVEQSQDESIVLNTVFERASLESIRRESVRKTQTQQSPYPGPPVDISKVSSSASNKHADRMVDSFIPAALSLPFISIPIASEGGSESKGVGMGAMEVSVTGTRAMPQPQAPEGESPRAGGRIYVARTKQASLLAKKDKEDKEIKEKKEKKEKDAVEATLKYVLEPQAGAASVQQDLSGTGFPAHSNAKDKDKDKDKKNQNNQKQKENEKGEEQLPLSPLPAFSVQIKLKSDKSDSPSHSQIQNQYDAFNAKIRAKNEKKNEKKKLVSSSKPTDLGKVILPSEAADILEKNNDSLYLAKEKVKNDLKSALLNATNLHASLGGHGTGALESGQTASNSNTENTELRETRDTHAPVIPFHRIRDRHPASASTMEAAVESLVDDAFETNLGPNFVPGIGTGGRSTQQQQFSNSNSSSMADIERAATGAKAGTVVGGGVLGEPSKGGSITSSMIRSLRDAILERELALQHDAELFYREGPVSKVRDRATGDRVVMSTDNARKYDKGLLAVLGAEEKGEVEEKGLGLGEGDENAMQPIVPSKAPHSSLTSRPTRPGRLRDLAEGQSQSNHPTSSNAHNSNNSQDAPVLTATSMVKTALQTAEHSEQLGKQEHVALQRELSRLLADLEIQGTHQHTPIHSRANSNSESISDSNVPAGSNSSSVHGSPAASPLHWGPSPPESVDPSMDIDMDHINTLPLGLGLVASPVKLLRPQPKHAVQVSEAPEYANAREREIERAKRLSSQTTVGGEKEREGGGERQGDEDFDLKIQAPVVRFSK